MNQPCREFHQRYHDCLDRRERPQADPHLLEHAQTCSECREWLAWGTIWESRFSVEAVSESQSDLLADSQSTSVAPSARQVADKPVADSHVTAGPGGFVGSSPSTQSGPAANNKLSLPSAARWWATVAAGVVVCWVAQPRSPLDGVRPEAEDAQIAVVPRSRSTGGDSAAVTGTAAPVDARPASPQLVAVAGANASPPLTSASSLSNASSLLPVDELRLGALAYDWLAPEPLSFAAQSPVMQRWTGELLATAPQFGGAALLPDLPWQMMRQRIGSQVVASQRFVDPVVQQLRPWSRTMNRAWNVWRRSIGGKQLDAPATES